MLLRLIPAPLHRQGLRLAHRIRLVWWRLRRPRLRGCRVLAFDTLGRVVLVRHAYGQGLWMLPGGGIGRGEDPLAAAARELAEEAGCVLIGARLVSVIEEPLSGAVNCVHLIAGRIEDEPRADGREIAELALFGPKALPDELSPRHRGQLETWIAQALPAARDPA